MYVMFDAVNPDRNGGSGQKLADVAIRATKRRSPCNSVGYRRLQGGIEHRQSCVLPIRSDTPRVSPYTSVAGFFFTQQNQACRRQ